jgi:predicted ATPase
MMLLQALAGNRSAALAQYETCRRILGKELNAKPLPETNALMLRIRDGAYDVQPASSPPGAGAVLFGREQELAWMRAEWALARKQPGRLTLVEGQMGMGKTALVEQLLRNLAASSDVTILRTRCLDFGESVPYQPIADLLRLGHEKRPDAIRRLEPVWRMELSSLLPELAESVPDSPAVWPAGDGDTARQRLYESVARFLKGLSSPPTNLVAGRGQREARAESKPRQQEWLVLFLDDLQWADAASFDLLRYLIFRLRSSPWWLIGAYQPEGMPSDQPLLTLRHSLAQEGRAGVLSLAPLSDRAVRAWTRALPGLQDEQARRVVKYVMDQSQGNPLIAAALIAELKSTALRQRPDGTWQLEPGWMPQFNTIPFVLRELVLLKLGRLSEPARRVLCNAAAIGVDFELVQLRRATGDARQIRSSLDEGLEQGLISLSEAGGYRFATDMMRHVVYEQLSQWERLEIKARMSEPGGKDTGKLLQLPGISNSSSTRAGTTTAS